MSDTVHLGLPLMAAAQAQKHVTHNEALLVLDALLHCAVADRDLLAPPPSPAEGARFIVAPGATGAWLGQDGRIAERRDGGWVFYAPKQGFVAFVADEAQLVVFDGSAWAGLVPPALQGLTRLGLGTTADATNPFAAKLNTALWTARGTGEGGSGDLRFAMNKQGAGATLSFLFQAGYSGRAEFGLVGNDDFTLKVSADGASWLEALRVRPDGRVGVGTSAPADRLSVAGAVAPATDNAFTLGTPARRFSTIYAATGAVSTSDVRAKTDIQPLRPESATALMLAAPPISFRWRVGALDDRGEGEPAPKPGRRTHLGWSAQAWASAMAAEGVDAGLLVRLAPDDPEGELGLRPDQITAVLHGALIDLCGDVDRLRGRVAELESAGR